MSRGRQLVLYFAIVFAGTWAVAGTAIFAPDLSRRIFGEITLSNPWVILGVYFPSLTSLALTAVLEGRAGLGRLVRRLNPAAVRPVWYAGVLLGMPLLAALAMLLLGDRPAFVGLKAALTGVGLGLVLDPGPIGEELGWRGYALPRLLERASPLVATLVLGVIWAIWHLPAFYLPGMPQSQLNLALFFVFAICVSAVMTWCHLGTGGSILLAILIHLVANHGGRLFGASFNATGVGFAIATLVLLAVGRSRWLARPAAAPPAT